VGVGKPYALHGHLIETGCLVGGFGVVAGQIAVAEVIGVNDNDVGQSVCLNMPSAEIKKTQD
jgi:hypothetical protein